MNKQESSLLELKTVTLSAKGQIALPKSIRQRRKLHNGSKLALLVYDDHVELRPFADLKAAVDLSRSGVITSLMSERSLAKGWTSSAEDKAWKGL